MRSASTELNDILSAMNAGNANLSRRLVKHSDDEVGILVSGINNFLATLQDIIAKIKSESGHATTLPSLSITNLVKFHFISGLFL